MVSLDITCIEESGVTCQGKSIQGRTCNSVKKEIVCIKQELFVHLISVHDLRNRINVYLS